jgi:hypothetical protein
MAFVVLAGLGGTVGAIIGAFGAVAPERIHHLISLVGF